MGMRRSDEELLSKKEGLLLKSFVYLLPNMAPHQDRYLINVSAEYGDSLSLTPHIYQYILTNHAPSSPLLQP